ncbi:MAG: hypothetical protein OXD49_15240 [Candidatus Poribacteria bacterium]|nr:hypothetical protein [Candidatus Poribacteria bacterium]
MSTEILCVIGIKRADTTDGSVSAGASVFAWMFPMLAIFSN